MSKLCPKCGSPISERNRFCPNCGSLLVEPPVKPSTSDSVPTEDIKPQPSEETKPLISSAEPAPTVEEPIQQPQPEPTQQPQPDPIPQPQPEPPKQYHPEPIQQPQPQSEQGVDHDSTVRIGDSAPIYTSPVNNDDNIIINEEGKKHLASFCSWTKFITITSMVILGLYFIAVLFAVPAMNQYHGISSSKRQVTSVTLIIVLIIIIVAFYVSFRGCRAACRFQDAIKRGEEDKVAGGFKDLRFIAVMSGIMSIISTIITIVTLLLTFVR